MPTTIYAARDYDPRKAWRRWQWIIGILCAAIITGEHWLAVPSTRIAKPKPYQD